MIAKKKGEVSSAIRCHILQVSKKTKSGKENAGKERGDVKKDATKGFTKDGKSSPSKATKTGAVDSSSKASCARRVSAIAGVCR